MASSPRIDELKKKFDENPRRYFAPLANEYRKAGDLEQAIQLCRAYLPQQPGHMSGHIVFGQALFESGQYEEARGVFETALGLDPENLIALRHLGDIAKQNGDPAGARGWYQRVLDADPRNEEIAAQLATLDAAAPPAEAPAQPAAAPRNDGGMGSWGEVNPEPSAAPAATAPPANAGSLELLDSLSVTTVTPPLGASAAPAPAPPAPRAEPEFERDGEGDFALPSPEAASRGAIEGVERSEEIDLRPREDGTSAGVAPVSRASGEQSFGSSNEFGFETMEFVPPSRAEDTRAAEPEQPRSAFGVPFTGEAAPAEETPAAFVTETMAELYLQQGFVQEALAVYRQLLAKNPTDAGLRERVASLEKGARSSIAVAAVSDEVIEHAEQRRTAKEPETIRSFFSALMRRRVLQRFIDLQNDAPEGDTGSEREPVTAAAPAIEPPAAPAAATAEPLLEWNPDSPNGEPENVPADDHSADDAFIIPEGVALPPGVHPHDVESTGAPLADEAVPEPVAPGSAADHAEYAVSETADDAVGNGTIDTLFGGGGGTSEDERAASVLSGAFPAVPGGTLDGKPAERAKDELSLDHVFREADRRSARASGAFSFDQFFSEGNAKPASRPTDPAASSVGGPDLAPDDDVAQFNDWLSGLKKK
ncbi:MAG TPA: tetratricopeptide repeat protein [Gemmatimonadaceae bacterium]